MQNGTAVLNPPVDMPEYDAAPVKVLMSVRNHDDLEVEVSSHTPGPWNFRPGYFQEAVYYPDAPNFPAHVTFERVIAKGDMTIAEVRSVVLDDGFDGRGYPSAPIGEAIANSNLFLAAPDLLQAAEQALKVFGKCPFYQEEFDAIVTLKAAIARATGQTAEVE